MRELVGLVAFVMLIVFGSLSLYHDKIGRTDRATLYLVWAVLMYLVTEP